MTHLTGPFTGIGVDPQVVSALALNSSLVRVTFSETMTDDAELADPTNYTIVEDVGSAARTVVSVNVPVVGLTYYVDLVLDGDLTAGTNNYNVAVSTAGPTDLAANTVDPADDDADFNGPTPLADTVVNADGGYEITLETVAPDSNYRIYVGPEGDTTDPKMWSTEAGFVVAVEDGLFTAFTPVLPVGGPYEFLLVDTRTGVEYTTLSELSVLPFEFRSGTLKMRGLLPALLDVGYRRVVDVDEQV